MENEPPLLPLEKIEHQLKRIADALENRHLKVYVANEPHPWEGVQGTFHIADDLMIRIKEDSDDD
tara:strand:+ start:113 stop:307 length:195 start_codon:yes stop_codon:yes gene_type:complete